MYCFLCATEYTDYFFILNLAYTCILYVMYIDLYSQTVDIHQHVQIETFYV